MGEQKKNGGLASSAGPSRLSGSQLKWRLDQMQLSSAQIGAGSSSSSSQQLAGAAATLLGPSGLGWDWDAVTEASDVTAHGRRTTWGYSPLR